MSIKYLQGLGAMSNAGNQYIFKAQVIRKWKKYLLNNEGILEPKDTVTNHSSIV